MKLRLHFAATLLAALFFIAALPSHAASIAFSNPACASFTMDDLGGGSFSITCNIPSVPVCTLTASSTTPVVGTPITLTTSCSGSPYGWVFTGTAASCGTLASQCTDTQASAGARTYTVFAGNPQGHGPLASVTVNWAAGASTPPTGCTVTRTAPASGSLPTTGGAITLTGSCSGGSAPTSFVWRKNGAVVSGERTASYSETLPANTNAAAITYSYDAQACAGSSCSPFSSPVTTVTVSGTSPVGFCSSYSDVRYIDLNWGSPPVDTSSGVGLAAGTVIVGRLTVPTTADSPGDIPGLVSIVEYQGPTADRLMNIATQPCDFRGYTPGMSNLPLQDPSGAGGPLAWSVGINPGHQFLLTGDPPGAFPVKPLLQAGQTYFINLRTIQFSTGNNSCTTGSCDVRVTVNPPR